MERKQRQRHNRRWVRGSWLAGVLASLATGACAEPSSSRAPGSASRALEGEEPDVELAACAALDARARAACQAVLATLAQDLSQVDASFGESADTEEPIGTSVALGPCSTAQLLSRSSRAFLFTRESVDLSASGFSSSFEVELPVELSLGTRVTVDEHLGASLPFFCQPLGTLSSQLEGGLTTQLSAALSLALDPRIDSDPLGNLQLIVHPTLDVQLPIVGLQVPLTRNTPASIPAAELAAAESSPAPVFLALQRELEAKVRARLQGSLHAQLGLDARGELRIDLPAEPLPAGQALQVTTSRDGFAAPGVYRAGCETEPRWRSVDSQTPLQLTFQNDSARTQSLYWLDFEGQRQLYAELAPGTALTQATFSTHPWLLSDATGRCEALVVPLPGGILAGPSALAGGGVADIASDLLDPASLVAIEVGGTFIDPLDPTRVQWLPAQAAPPEPALARASALRPFAAPASLLAGRPLLRIQTPELLPAGTQYLRLTHRSGSTHDWPFEAVVTDIEPDIVRGIAHAGSALGDDGFPVGTDVIQLRLLGDEAAEQVNWLYELNAFPFSTNLLPACDAVPLFGSISGFEKFYAEGTTGSGPGFAPQCGSSTRCHRIAGTYQLGGGKNSIQLTIERTPGAPEPFVGGWVSNVPGLYEGQLLPPGLEGSYIALTSTRTGRQLLIRYTLGPRDRHC